MQTSAMATNRGRIAICGEYAPDRLKHRLLFFDRIGIFEPEVLTMLLRSVDEAEVANDLEFLQSNNLVFNARPVLSDAISIETPSEEQSTDVSAASLIDAELRKVTGIFRTATKKPARLTRAKLYALYSAFVLLDSKLQFYARICARHMQRSTGEAASAVFSGPLSVPSGLAHLYKYRQSPTDVISLVLDKLPMPSENTPWEAIIDFKADADAQGYLQGLKVWMSEMARQNLTPTEANEKLEWLIFQHKKHLRMHKLKYRWGTLGGTFVAAAEVFEDLAKFKWGKAAGAVVSIFDRRIELIEAELKNPAHEVAYIVKAQELFED